MSISKRMPHRDVGTTRLGSAWKIVTEGAKNNAFAGAVAFVEQNNSVLLHKAVGFSNLFQTRERMTPETLFDLASITKVVATATSIMILVERKRLDLDTKVVDLFPNFSKGRKKNVRIKHLLCHTSGLPPWADLYTRPNANKASILKEICEATPLQSTPGARATYSDLGYILLGEIVNKVSEQPLDRFARREIYKPLGMDKTGFVPAPDTHDVAAAEFSNWRFRLIRGEVHDENAAAMGGVSGHAGLFSTASDLAIFCRMMLNKGSSSGKRVLSKETVQLMTRNHTRSVKSYFGLGWRVKTQRTPDVGKELSIGSYGHNGYTGTSIWLDVSRSVFMILLTNRVHPVREGIPGLDGSIGIMMRRRMTWKQVLQNFHNAVIEAAR